MPTLQYLEEKIWSELLGIKDIEILNDDKQIEEHFAVEVDHNGFVESKKTLKVKNKVKMKNQKYFWYKVDYLVLPPKLYLVVFHQVSLVNRTKMICLDFT